jgi:hypothetical protein
MINLQFGMLTITFCLIGYFFSWNYWIDVINSLKERGYTVIIKDDGNIPYDIKTISNVTILK